MKLYKSLFPLFLSIIIAPFVMYIVGFNKLAAGGIQLIPIMLLTKMVVRVVYMKQFENEKVIYSSYKGIITLIQFSLISGIFVIIAFLRNNPRQIHFILLGITLMFSFILIHFENKEIIVSHDKVYIKNELYFINSCKHEISGNKIRFEINNKFIIVSRNEELEMVIDKLNK